MSAVLPGPLGVIAWSIDQVSHQLLGAPPHPQARAPKNGVHAHGQDANGPVGQHKETTHHKKKAHPKSRKPAAYVFPVRTGDLEVDAGQITFEAEGSETATSPYFSRKIIWPGNAESGVTIGRGYDMGGRSEQAVTDDLVAAGLDAKSAAAFAKGAGKKGAGKDDKSAQGFVANHREELGTISTAVQKKLFENIYVGYVTRAQDLYNHWLTSKGTAWAQLKPAIRDIMVDFVYQGFGAYEKNGKPFNGGTPLKKGMNNDYQELIDYITTSKTMQGYEAGRHRADYLRAAMAREKAASPNAASPTSPK